MIVYLGEATVAFAPALRVYAGACFRQAVEQCVEVVNDVVRHERGWAGHEVFGGVGENAPDCHLLFLQTPPKYDYGIMTMVVRS